MVKPVCAVDEPVWLLDEEAEGSSVWVSYRTFVYMYVVQLLLILLPGSAALEQIGSNSVWVWPG